jgi:CRP-like cAMP-binding protein
VSDERAQLIGSVPLFAGCSADEVGRVARYTRVEHREPGEALVEEGAAGSDFFVLAEGHVEVLRDGEVINTLGPGEFFGEVGLLAHAGRNATVRAATPVRVLVLPARGFRSLIGRYPSIFERVVGALETRT